jgi:Mg2+-importing ATPase
VIHVLRTTRVPGVQSRASWPLTATTLGVCAVGVMLPYSPLAGALGLVALPWAYWPIVLTVLVAYLGLAHVLMRRVWRTAHGVVKRVALPPS